MKKALRVVIFIILTYCFGLAWTASTKDEKKEEIDITQFKNEEGFKCKKDIPTLTIGDIFVTANHTLQQIEKEQEVFILGVSNSLCIECCKGEIVLAQVRRLFDIQEFDYKKKPIPIVRLDEYYYSEMIEKSNIRLDGVPRLYLFYNSKYYVFSEGDHLNLFLLFLNRIINPVVKLKTEELTEMFFNAKVEWIESTSFYKVKYRSIYDIFPKMNKITRVIAFVSDEKRFSKQINELYSAARDLGIRTDLRIGIVTNATIVQKYVDVMGINWFNSSSTNSIVLFDNKKLPTEKKYYYDLESNHLSIKNWINLASIEEVNEFNSLTYQIMEMLHMPIFIAFLEKNYTQSEISKQLVGRLSVMAHEFPRILFSYIDKPDLYFLRNKVSITWEELPSLGLFNNEGMMPIVFPRNQPFTIPNLRAFFGAFMNGTTYNASFTLPNLNLNYGENMKHAFQVQLSNSSSLSSNESGISRLQNHTIDTLLLMFNSSNSFLTNYQITEMYEMIASLFSNIGASTVDFAYLDVGKSTVPKYLQSNETLPHIQFLPAFNKGEISFKNIGSLNIGDIIQYVRKNAKTDLIEAFKTFDLMYGSQEIVTEDIIDSDKVELLEDL